MSNEWKTPKADYYCDRQTILSFALREVVTDEDADIRAMAIDLLEYMDEERARCEVEEA